MPDKRESNRAGLDAEKAVGAFLRSKGWAVLEHRWVGAGAEVDLIVLKDGKLRFVEVKLRQADDPVGLEAIDARKIRRIERSAQAYLQGFDDYDEVCLAVAYVIQVEGVWRIEFLDNPS